MKLKIIFQILIVGLIFIPFQSWSQYSEIHGKILDKQTLQSIPYCSVSLTNLSIGTCSNNSGEFIFHYPDSLKTCSLTVRCIGYKTMLTQLSTLPDNETANIYLEPESYEIPEIVIDPNPPTAIDIVKKVIKNLHKNYTRSPYYMEGFLRDKVFNLTDKRNTRLTEAAVEIVKKEFGSENSADKVKVTEIRNSYNYSKLGSLWKEKIAQTFWGYSTENPIYTILQYKDLTDARALSELVKSDLYGAFISGYTMFDNKPVVIIDLKEEFFKFLFQKMPSKNLYRQIRLYIDTESYAMLKTEYYLVEKPSKELQSEGYKLYFKQDTIATFAVKQYERMEGKYYLKYAGYTGRIHDQPDVNETGKTLYFNETELLINKLIINKKEFDRIKHRDLLEKEVPLWDMKYVYDPSFWKNYNILIDKPLDSKVQKDLEKEIPLDNQFIDAGMKNSKNQK